MILFLKDSQHVLGDISVLGYILRPHPDGLPAQVYRVPDGLLQGVRGHGDQQVHRALPDVVRRREQADEQSARGGHSKVQSPASLLLLLLPQQQTDYAEEDQDIQVCWLN